MKVLHIGKYFPPYTGGMENYLRDLMGAQAVQGIDTAALVHQSDIGFSSNVGSYRAGKQQLPITRAAVWARFLFTPISPAFPWLLNRLIKQQKPDILHLHMPNVSVFWALFFPKARRIPWVVHWHADVLASEHSFGLRLFYTLYRRFERTTLEHCKAIISTSPPYLDSSVPLRPFREKCHVIPLGLDGANLPKTDSPSKAVNAPLRVLAIGRLTYYKGFEYLIRAAADCDNVEIHIVGKGEQESHLKAVSQRLQLHDRVTFHGYLSAEKLAEQLAACDCLCLPSIERTEAFGMVLIEAMYFSKATVTSAVPGSGMGWVVDDGITGLLVAPEDTPALAESLRNLQQDHGKVRRLGGNGRRKFDRLFHINRSAAGVSELYKLVLGATSNNQENARS